MKSAGTAAVQVPKAEIPSAAITSDLRGTIQIVQPGGLDHLYDLIAASFWPLLIALLVFIYRGYVRKFLAALVMRVENGASLKAGIFEIGPVNSQSAAEQAAKLDAEAKQAIEQDGEVVAHHGAQWERFSPQYSQTSVDALKLMYVIAEDLSLREIQSEFKSPVVRNVRVGEQEFDGYMAVADAPYFIEAKVFRRRVKRETAYRIADRFSTSLRLVRGRATRGILAVVYAGDEDIDLLGERQKWQTATRAAAVPIEVRTFRLKDLSEKYRVVVNYR